MVVSLFFVSCSRNKPNTIKGVLNLQLGGEPSILNPILATDSPSFEVIGLIFNGLLRVNEELELEPDLAESYEIKSNGKRYLFKLRKDVKWHDGQPFTAKDVVFTFNKILDPKTNTVRRSNYLIDGKAIKFSAIDDYTVQVDLPKPFSPFLAHMAASIVPEHLLKNEDINTASFNRAPIGTGPFKLSEWKTAQYVSVEKNEHYHSGDVKLEKIILKIIPDEQTALLALKNSEIDNSKIPYKDKKKLDNHSVFDIYQYSDLVYTYMAFNLKHPFFKDPKVREAISTAINKPALVNSILKGYGEPAWLPSSPVSWAYPEGMSFNKYQYNLVRSRDLFEEAGFVLNPKTQLLEKNGKVFEFTLITNKDNKDRERTAQIIQQFLKMVGIKVNIQLMEWASFIKIVNAPVNPKKFDAVILGWSLGLDPDGYSIWHSSEYPKGFNFIAYNNPIVDDALIKGRLETDKEKRKLIYKDMYREIAKDLPYIFLYYPQTLSGMNNRVKGISKPGPGGLLNRIENVITTY